MMMSKTSNLKKLLLSNGADMVGIANLKNIPVINRRDFNTGISIAVRMDPDFVSNINNRKNQEVYPIYKKQLNDKLEKLEDIAVNKIREFKGGIALGMKPTNTGIDPKNYSTKLPHKTVATRAGLGWVGKNGLLITKEFGAAIRLTTVLTNIEFETDLPINDSYCETCNQCVINCPSQAILGENWNLDSKREDIFDCMKCKNWQKQFAENLDLDVVSVSCGICIKSCIWTKKYIEKTNI